jgi:dihydrofolate reductase
LNNPNLHFWQYRVKYRLHDLISRELFKSEHSRASTIFKVLLYTFQALSGLQERASSKVSVFIGMSLDGFIARLNGDLDWMRAPGVQAGDDYGYSKFMERIDAIVMGRKTFEKVLTFENWPYEKPVFVLTRRPLRIPAELQKKIETMSGAPAEVVDWLAKRGFLRLYVDGGQTIQGFLRAGLVHELIVSQLPILIGTGIPLFGPLRADIRLKHVETRTFAGGMVQSTYEVGSFQ